MGKKEAKLCLEVLMNNITKEAIHTPELLGKLTGRLAFLSATAVISYSSTFFFRVYLF